MSNVNVHKLAGEDANGKIESVMLQKYNPSEELFGTHLILWLVSKYVAVF